MKNKKTSGLGIAGLILGIIGMMLSIIVIGIVPCIIGLILSIVALTQKDRKHGTAIGGIVCSVIGIAIFVLFLSLLSTDEESTVTNSNNEVVDIKTEEKELTEDIAPTLKIEITTEPTPIPTPITTPTPKPTPIPEKTIKSENKKEESENKFLIDMKKYMSADLSEKTYDILTNKIGFSSLEFKEKVDDTFNYKIYADGYEVIITDIIDDVRIFIPNSSYIFYEDGEVVLTKAKFDDKKIDHYDQYSYYIMAQDIVTSCLKNPNSANFPSIVTSPGEISMQKNGDLIAVQSYVDAENSFGAEVRSKWTVQFIVLDMNTYSYELVYANVDGNKIGEFIEMD